MLLNEFLKEHRKNEEQEATIAQVKIWNRGSRCNGERAVIANQKSERTARSEQACSARWSTIANAAGLASARDVRALLRHVAAILIRLASLNHKGEDPTVGILMTPVGGLEDACRKANQR